jgi:hypothetical protein
MKGENKKEKKRRWDVSHRNQQKAVQVSRLVVQH